MSFILDALKKSEAERQRQAGPTLLELRITHPRRRYPLWSLLVGALLAINITVLLVFLLRRPPAVPPASTPSAAITPAPAAGGPAVLAAEPSARAVPAAAATAAVRAAAGPAGVTNVPALAAQPGDHPAAPGQGSAAQASSTAADLADTAQGRNPADYEPALPGSQEPAARATPTSPAGAVDYSNLPSISQISGNIPAMQLDLLDYSELSSERYALINMQRVREGDVLADGARVLAITPNGVAMDYRGQNFLLRPGGTAQ